MQADPTDSHQGPMTEKTRRPMLKRMIRIVLLFLLVYWTVGWFVQRRMVFPAHWANRQTSRVHEAIEGIEVHHLDTDEGRTEWWFLPAEGASADAPAPLLVFTHGNGELIDGQAPIVRGFAERGFHVALCEYRGYGRSEGTASQASATADALAMVGKVLERPDVDGSRVVYYGRSLGGGVACSLTAERPPEALILQSTFAGMTPMMARYLIPPFLVRDPFDNAGTVEAYEEPVLVLHGTSDLIVPYSESDALVAASDRVERVTYDCGHNDFPTASAEHWDVVESFLAGAGLLPDPGR